MHTPPLLHQLAGVSLTATDFRIYTYVHAQVGVHTLALRRRISQFQIMVSFFKLISFINDTDFICMKATSSLLAATRNAVTFKCDHIKFSTKATSRPDISRFNATQKRKSIMFADDKLNGDVVC